ncbi:MAG: toll/interleukin-1 receptor domain-containing protein [Anaerolineae bacterium]|jgi:hypothetical protein|nr:toll/interleukin-1 receptor domain-containing protein [Anaerolineae bacterium]
MSHNTKRLFIGYRTTDSAQVDRIAHNLRLLTYADGTARYLPWQDKRDLPLGVPNWWDAILDAIEQSDLFVFHLTLESLKSEVCQAELDYAYRLNLPIIVVVLDGAYTLIPTSGSYRLHDEIQALLPKWLRKIQWLFYTGAAEFFTQFQTAVETYERDWPTRTSAKRPLHIGDPWGGGIELYAEACERAYALEFQASEELFRELVRRKIADFAEIGIQWLELLQHYQELILIDSQPHTRFMFKKRWEAYLTLFPNDFFLDKDEIFDPKSFRTRFDTKIDPP